MERTRPPRTGAFALLAGYVAFAILPLAPGRQAALPTSAPGLNPVSVDGTDAPASLNEEAGLREGKLTASPATTERGASATVAAGFLPMPAAFSAATTGPLGDAPACSSSNTWLVSVLGPHPACQQLKEGLSWAAGGDTVYTSAPRTNECECLSQLAYDDVYHAGTMCTLPQSSAVTVRTRWLQCQSRSFCLDFSTTCPFEEQYPGDCDLMSWSNAAAASPGMWYRNGASPAENTLVCRLVNLARAQHLGADVASSCHAASPGGGHVCLAQMPTPYNNYRATIKYSKGSKDGSPGGNSAEDRLPGVTPKTKASKKYKGKGKGKGKKDPRVSAWQQTSFVNMPAAARGSSSEGKGPLPCSVPMHRPTLFLFDGLVYWCS